MTTVVVVILVSLAVLDVAANSLSNHRDTWWYRTIMVLSLALSILFFYMYWTRR